MEATTCDPYRLPQYAYVQAQQLVRPEHVEATTWKRQLVTLIGFCTYCELIECSRPIRFFIVSLMYNKYQYWPSEGHLLLFS